MELESEELGESRFVPDVEIVGVGVEGRVGTGLIRAVDGPGTGSSCLRLPDFCLGLPDFFLVRCALRLSGEWG